MKKALTVGGAMVDTIAIIDSDRIERITMRNADISFLLLEEGRKTESSEISTHCGGGAINAAVAMARLGHDVSTLVKLGQDSRADMILTRLSAEGVSTRWASRTAKAATGAAVMIAAHDRNAAIFTFRGANTLLSPDDLKDDAFAVDLVYITTLSNESADCFPELVAKAKAHDAMVATNPGIRQLTARQDAFHACVADIDILALNRNEADALVPSLIQRFGEGGPALPLEPDEQPPALVARGFESGGFHISLMAFVRAMLELGVKWVVITDGREGGFVATDQEIIHCPTPPCQVAGTAGAGDAFSSTLSVSLADGKSVEEAVLAATVNATSVIGYVDTQTGLLDGSALEKRRMEAAKQLKLRRWKL